MTPGTLHGWIEADPLQLSTLCDTATATWVLLACLGPGCARLFHLVFHTFHFPHISYLYPHKLVSSE